MSGLIYPINDKRYTAEDVEIFNCTRTSGVYAVLDFDCSLSGDTLTIGKGLAWIKNGEFSGKTIAFTEPETLTLEYADDTYDRYDVVAIRYDATKKEPELVIKKGVASALPEMPTRSTETYLYELYLYSILREKGEPFPLFANITDLRRDTEYCGIMRDSVTSVVDVMRETLYEDENGAGQLEIIDAYGMTLEPEEYGSLIATVKYGNVSVDMPLYKVNTTSRTLIFAGETKTLSNGTFTVELQPTSGGFSVETVKQDSGSSPQGAKIIKLVGIPEESQGYVAVDSLYNPESHNAQSGEAVKQAIEEALKGFEGGGGNIEIPENVETTDNKVTTIDENSTDTQYPSAKAVYDFASKNQGSGGNTENSAFQVLPTGKNLLNRETDTIGYNLTETGELASNENFEVTDFIPVVENESYHLSKNGVGTSARTICFYDTHKNVLSFASNTVTGKKFIAPEKAKYVRFSFAKSATEVQFEQSEVVTEYEAFVGKEQIGYNELYIPKRAIPSEALKCMTKKAGGKNLLDRTVSEVGKVILATGELSSNSSAETSDFIPVAFGDNLYISGTPDGSYATVLVAYTIYDENKQIIKTVINAGTYGENPLPIPRHARFVRYSYRTKGTNIQIERGTEATEFEEYIGVPALANELIGVKMPNDLPYSLNPWSGKRLVVDGDSITHDQGNYNYWQFIAAQLTDMRVDISDTTSQYASGWKGVGGSRIANDPVESTDDPKYSIVLRYQNLPDDADLVIIAGGTNDWQHGNVELGDFDSTDNHTFNGALNELLLGLKLKYKYIPIVMMTPIKRGSEYNLPNKKGLYQEQFVDAMIAKCRQYGIYCLDMYSNCPLNPQIPELNETFFLPSKNSDGSIRYDEQGNIMYDATHPNTEGHKIMGRTVAGFIRTLN